jgi:signal transduction histidine kinase
MPDTIRAKAGRLRADRCASFLAKSLIVAAAWAPPRPAAAAEPWLLADIDRYVTGLAQLHRHELAALALIVGVVSFAVVTAVGLVRTRSRAQRAAAADRAEIVRLREQVDRAHALLFSEPQVVIAWDARFEEPEVLGDPGIVNSVPIARRILAFASWLDADQARAMERAVEALRSRGLGFAIAVTTLLGRPIEAEGRAIGGRAVLRLKEVSGVRSELGEIAARHDKLLRDIDAIRTLIEALPSPIWAGDAAGRKTWVNPAYAHAVDVRDGAEAVARGLELLDPAARAELATARDSGEPYAARLAVIVAGTRRIFDVFDLATRNGRAGIGIDVTEVETTRGELARTIEAHRRTLDQLPTAVAIFGADQRLTFHNAAYRALWGLTSDFLDQLPSDSAVLDQLRAARKLPEQADFRSWKNELHEAYRAVEATEHLWHLPDGRTLRVITTPNPDGGITYLFDDVTEALELKRRYDALIRVQGETLDHLSEAVAVFGSDGRLRLFNPVFAGMWRLLPSLLAERPHVEAVIAACQALHDDDMTWQSLRGAVTGLEHRQPIAKRLERKDGSVIDCATMPLPDGATLVTFQDVTDSVNVERALRERNEALQAAYDLKNDFVHLVSYELRSPMTNIIGFAQLLEDPAVGPLADKQREYLGYINSSSASLLAIINDILDLATIDAGVMRLDLGPVDIRAIVDTVAEAVRDRLGEHGLKLEIRADGGLGSFTADERRLRQILYNLLINAIGFSPAGEVVTLAAERRSDAVVFRVTDRGPGIPTEIQDRVFDRFETHALGSRHRGTGLGLSIVRSFVELHGGTVQLDSAVGRGTTVVCAFPLEHVAERAAAAE